MSGDTGNNKFIKNSLGLDKDNNKNLLRIRRALDLIQNHHFWGPWNIHIN